MAFHVQTTAISTVYAEIPRMHIALVQVALALASYRNERGSYPEALELLRGENLDELPQDIFSDSPLQYRRDGSGYVLYSVGRNGEDDGGTDWLQDIVVATPDSSSSE